MKTQYSFNNSELYIGGGILGMRHSLLPAYKIQNITIEQTPYEWSRGLASLRIDTAAGKVIIPFVKYKKAGALLDRLIYKVEKTQKGSQKANEYLIDEAFGEKEMGQEGEFI